MIILVRVLSLLLSLLQLVLWTAVLQAVYPEEAVCKLLMVTAAGISLALSIIAPGKRWLLYSGAVLHLLGILSYILPALIEDGEMMEGLLMMSVSGWIVLIILPPALNIVLLLYLAFLDPRHRPSATN
jgi:hypothetical protein